MVRRDQSAFDISIPDMKRLFYKKKGFFPNLQQFFTIVRKEKGERFYVDFRPSIEKFYYAQEIVQVMGGFPRIASLNHDASVYPPIISFEPFERLYVDQAFINLYDKPKVDRRARVLPERVVAEEEETKEGEADVQYKKPDWTSDARWVEFLDRELRFPPELRVFYRTGNPFRLNSKERTSPSKVKLFKARAEFILSHENQFSKDMIDKARETGMYEELLQGWQKDIPRKK